MLRNILLLLEKWSSSPSRRSLILRGSRQVGKTWAVRELARRLGLTLVEVNFERLVSARRAFDGDLDPEIILQNLEITLNTLIDRQSTLLFLDEVQDCPRALTALKHFTENLSLRVIAAGSYLGLVEGKGEGASQPIGYVDELTMHPMAFDEFVRAAQAHPTLLELLAAGDLPSSTAHRALLDLYRDYLFVGGMPAVVDLWFTRRAYGASVLESISEVRAMQKDLLLRYKADFAKYYPRDAFNIGRTWELVAEQLAKSMTIVNRFKFKSQISGKRDFRAFANYFACLEACGLIHRSFMIERPLHPLRAHKRESLFKCYYFDTGLLLAEVDFAYAALAGDQDVSYKGPIAENFIACELVRHGVPLFCYAKANSTAEIEFIAQREVWFVPIEVKNNDTRAKSLDSFMKEFHPEYAIKFSNRVGDLSTMVKHYPIYVAGVVLRRLVSPNYLYNPDVAGV